MRWKLVQFIVLFAIFLVFIVFNLENKCDINFIFIKISEVPVFLTVFFSFMIGMLCILPFVFFKSKKKTDPLKKESPAKTGKKDKNADKDANLSSNTLYGID